MRLREYQPFWKAGRMFKTAYPRSGLPWTIFEEEKLRGWFVNKRMKEIADLLERTPSSVGARAKALGLRNGR